MAAFISLITVVALMAIAAVGAGMMNLRDVFGVFIPYVAFAVFVVGFLAKVVGWAKTPVPFRIPTTGGQQKSLSWIKDSPLDNPSSTLGTVARMGLEIFLFRSLFRNTKIDLRQDGMKLAYGSAKALWLFALLFHYSFFLVAMRHLRFFTEPMPLCITSIEFVDSILQIGVPALYLTDLVILAGAGFLLLRRFCDAKVKYISLPADYFPLFLILAIALSGVYMRYFVKVDVIAIKQLTMGLVTFSPNVPKEIETTFFVHVFLVSVLMAYFPFSKLMHMGGVFLSPTRNMPNDSRIRRHINPWNDPNIKPHSYEAYENDFREKMIEAGLPVEKEA